MVNKQGQTRLCQYFEHVTVQQREAMEAEMVRKCLARGEQQVGAFFPLPRSRSIYGALTIPHAKKKCSFIEYRQYKVIYRRYASLFFVVGVDNRGKENELAILEFIHTMVETLDKYFENVCELDIMFNIEKAHFILDEMVMNGHVVETNKSNILTPVKLMDKLGN